MKRSHAWRFLPILFLTLLGACGEDDPTAPGNGATRVQLLAPPAGAAEVRAAVLDGRWVHTAIRSVSTTGEGALAIYDAEASGASEADTLQTVATLALPEAAGGLAQAGSILYCGMLNSTRLVDVSDPANPQLLASPTLPGGYNGARVDGTRLLLFNGGNLYLYDVTDPANPALTHSSPSDCWSGDVYGDRFVMGQILPQQRFLLYDVSVAGTFDNFAPATTEVGGSIYFAQILQQNLYVLVEYFGETRSNLITYDLAGLDVDGSIAAVDTLQFDRLVRSLASDESELVVSSSQYTAIYSRGPDGRLMLDEELIGVGGRTNSGFPHYGDIVGKRIVVAGQPAMLLTR